MARVTGLLKDMQTTLNKEKEQDDKEHDKFMCWCETTEKEKSASISANTQRSEQLTSDVEEHGSAANILTEEVSQTTKQIAANQNALDTAQGIRDEEASTFHKTSTDSIQAIANLKAAIAVLSKHQGEAFPQLTAESFLSTKTTHHHMGSFTQSEVNTVMSARRTAALLATRIGFTYTPAYESASSEIFGVMTQLLKEFEKDAAEAEKKENEAISLFDSLKGAKEGEIAAGTKLLESRTTELATTKSLEEQAKEDLADTAQTLATDTKFLADARKNCAATDAEFLTRQGTRSQEIEAVSSTLAILNSDEAKDLFTNTFSFVHKSSSKAMLRQTRVAALLRSAAKKTGNQALITMSVQAKLDAFENVKKAITDMVASLKKQQADEVKKNDYCKESFQENAIEASTAKAKAADISANNDSLASEIEQINAEIAATKAAVADTEVSLQRLNEDRKENNLNFQQTVKDSKATVEVLRMAYDKLASFYAFVQTSARKGHGGGEGVLP